MTRLLLVSEQHPGGVEVRCEKCGHWRHGHYANGPYGDGKVGFHWVDGDGDRGTCEWLRDEEPPRDWGCADFKPRSTL